MERSEVLKTEINLVLEQCLGLVPTVYSHTNEMYLQGPIKIGNKWIQTKVQLSLLGNSENIYIQTQHQHRLKIKKISEISKLMENISGENQRTQNGIICNIDLSANHNRSVYTEIASLWQSEDYDIFLNKNCTYMRFEKFAYRKQHYLELALPSIQILKHSLPSCIDLQSLVKEVTGLKPLLQKFLVFLEELKPFYENFTDIDELCQVVQPSKPTTKENWRMFVLKERVFLKIEFKDPFAPLSTMVVNVVGPTEKVGPLRHVFDDGLRDWDPNLNVHKNLLRIFDLCFFPLPSAIDSEPLSIFCHICCCHNSELGDIPIVSCDNANCSLIFHTSCLKKWFTTLKESKTFLHVAFGFCPFCRTDGGILLAARAFIKITVSRFPEDPSRWPW
uniref:RING-type domain-containing protein n=1 Tax=Glossina pallidipes TaxID=7398 RepID=A0A1B0A9R6_GLOPL